MGTQGEGKGVSWQSLYWQRHRYNERRRITRGSYLRSFCPHCGVELTHDHVIELEAEGPTGDVGRVVLSAHLNVYRHASEILLPEGQQLNDLRCPACHESLVVQGKLCGKGDARVASFLVSVATAKVPFFICMRKGCRWHEIAPADAFQIILDDSHEW